MANGQTSNNIPFDKEVRTGKLANGLTYYVRANAKPEKQAEFYIFHYVGAVQEEDNQDGLAHFLEHMAFNGTKNLPDKKIINWCESVGIKFGQNLNAYTSLEQTVYNVSAVPLDKTGNLDTCLLILHEWSQFIALEGEEIDKERGVILEEKRTRNTANRRIYEKSLPLIYGDTRYAKRSVLGSVESLNNFKHEDIRDFYHRWYRTDLQCIIVVGDFDADVVVEKIKKLFADVKAVKNPEEKVIYQLPKNTEPIIGVLTDVEYMTTDISIRIKHTPISNEIASNKSTYSLDLTKSLINRMANARLREITQKPNAPFISGGLGGYRMAVACDVVSASASAREGEALIALEAIYGELEKIRRFGFTQDELEIAKANYLKAAEVSYNNRNDRRHREFVSTYINNFKFNLPVPDAQTEWNLDSEIISKLSLEEVNNLAKQLITKENQVITISAPEKAGTYPTEKEVAAVIKKVLSAELEAYKSDFVKEPLIPETAVLKGSTVAKEEKDKFGATVWTLKNGVKIVVKQTDFKADEVRITISSQNGSSNIPVSDYEGYITASNIGRIMFRSGIGNLNMVNLSKLLAGKSAYIHVHNVMDYSTGMYAGGSPDNIETVMQLIYMNFTHPRWHEDDFNVFLDNNKSQLKNNENSPDYIFGKEWRKIVYNDNPRRNSVSSETFDKIKFDRLPEIHQQFFGNAANFVFIFVGNIELATLKPLVEKYIGSIPADLDKKTKWKNDEIIPVRGMKDHFFETKMQTPKTSIEYTYSGDMDYTLENRVVLDVLSQILRIRYTEVIREEKGGTYGVRVSGNLSRAPQEIYTINISFDSDKEKVEKLGLLDDITIEFEKIAKAGATPEDLNKIKEFLVKQHKDIKNNESWQHYLENYHLFGFDALSDYARIVDELNTEQIRKMAEKILNDKNRIRVIMNNEE